MKDYAKMLALRLEELIKLVSGTISWNSSLSLRF